MPKTPKNPPATLHQSPWWDSQRHEDRRPKLRARARIKSAIRRWFESQGFIEVETSCLQVSPGLETHLHAFKTQLIGTNLEIHPLYLHTSPEFACKKLLAAGERKIFTFAPVFRNRERGPTHHPEFTMLEWYRVGEPYDVVINDTLELIKIAAAEAATSTLMWANTHCNPHSQADTLTVNEAFKRFARIDLNATLRSATGDRDALKHQATRQQITCTHADTWSDIFSKILAAKVEPALGIDQPTVLKDYPLCEAALARPTTHDPTVAERFELYCCGIELANGFGELTDPIEQRKRFEHAILEKQMIYGESYPIDEDFLAALAHMPPASGVALGFDRLVMLATHAQNIEDVIWTPLPPTN